VEINPYSPAAPVEADTYPPAPLNHPIVIDGLVHRSDLRAIGRNEPGIRTARTVLIFGSGCLTLATIVFVFFIRSNPTGQADGFELLGFTCLMTFVVIPFLVLLPAWSMIRLSGGSYGRKILKISPQIIGPLTGRVDNDTIELRYMNYHWIAPLESLTGVHIKPDAIALTTDARRFFLAVLPRHVFQADDFQRVAERLKPIADQRPLIPTPTIAEDHRLMAGDPLELLPQPVAAIRFAGTVNRRDLSGTKIYKQQIRKFFIANLLLVAIAILLPTLVYVTVPDRDIILIILLASFVSLPMLWSVAKRLLIFRQYCKQPNGEISKLSGWVTEGNLTVNSPIGSYAYLKKSFKQVDCDDQSIQCLPVGIIPQVIILPRRFFQSDTDYTAVGKILCGDD